MDKTDAIRMLGGSVRSVADAIGISRQAVNKWPQILPPRIADRVIAAVARQGQMFTRPDGSVVLDERKPENAGQYIAPKRRATDKPSAR